MLRKYILYVYMYVMDMNVHFALALALTYPDHCRQTNNHFVLAAIDIQIDRWIFCIPVVQ